MKTRTFVWWCGGFAGALVVSATGVGTDMVLYTAMILIYRAGLKIAIPTSVLIMAFNSLLVVAVKPFWVRPGVYKN
ncbi:hypothetical protein [Aliiglaciecola aliphaticivorans]